MVTPASRPAAVTHCAVFSDLVHSKQNSKRRFSLGEVIRTGMLHNSNSISNFSSHN